MKPKGFAGLTPKQQERYRARLQQLGANVDEALKIRIDTRDFRGPVLLTSDLKRTAIIPSFLPVRSVAELKQGGGVPDSEIRSGGTQDTLTYPPPWESRYDKLSPNNLTPELRKNIRAALRAWMIGDSARVSSYEKIINAVHFPQAVWVFSGDTLCVKAGTSVVIAPSTPGSYTNANPYVVNFTEVCIEYGGQIQFQVPTSMNVATMTRLAQGASCDC
ncbi:hypothetical protein COCOR_06903 [Corallococcus coralloides DSM 2259]|uniref:Uncharacterized protein n=1 Tax=Corallococcus coralloides (strain ATCC 25202 / DSM 2259 / NBRC 100086 / M2) TaxID=1144275 RepID=H8N2A7_CORCM|nr:hypothetical protein [Corallococcus coralloides]AFE07212.1 hypothetical protein COCOR_06903 [Corallococcus coralloides DSM 2259]